MKEYIERELVVKQLKFSLDLCEKANYDDEYEEQYKIGAITARQDDIHSIKSLPVADVVPVVYAEYNWTNNTHYRCSKCGEKYYDTNIRKYCSECGAKFIKVG